MSKKTKIYKFLKIKNDIIELYCARKRVDVNEIENHFIYNDNNINTNSFDISILGIIIYDEFANTDVAKDVQDFVTNVTVTGEKNQSVKVPDKIIETTVDALESSDEKINYDTQKIDKYIIIN